MGSDSAQSAGAIATLLADWSSGAESLEAVARTRFRGETPLVLFGAGGLGRRMNVGLRRVGLEPVAFSDNDPSLWATEVEGLPVLSPAQAGRTYGADATVVVTIWRAEGGHAYGQTRRQLANVGCRDVASFLELSWAHPDEFLPYMAADRPTSAAKCTERMLKAWSLFQDEVSRAEFLRQAKWRLRGEFDAVATPSDGCDGANEYWPEDLFTLSSSERVVDCGAFDGDTLSRFVSRYGGCDSWLALEPDPRSAAALRRRVRGIDRERVGQVTIREAATGREGGSVVFDALGSAASHVSEGDGVAVEVVRLDDECAGRRPTLVKLDVEGQEAATLGGARQLLATGEAIWAISCYHRQADLWELPLLVEEAMPGAHLFLRAHAAEAFDLVLYAVPEGRLMGSSRAG